MAINNIIQVAGSNTLRDAKTPEQLRKEIRDLTVKVNDALRRLSQFVQTSGQSGGTVNINVSTESSGEETTVTVEAPTFRRHFLLMEQ
jgi:hypothetical protein